MALKMNRMKKTFTIVAITVLIWGCAKKMAPAKTTIPTSNTGSVIAKNTETAPPVINTPAPVNTPANTSTVFTADANNATKTVVKAGMQSPQVLQELAGQSTFNAKCGACHGLKVTTNYTSERWASIMAVMANGSHANLNDTEKENVLAYVRANSKK